MFFLDQKVKVVISSFSGTGFQKLWQPANNMQWLKKERVKVWIFLFFSPYSCFGLNLGHLVMPDMYCGMQNKLSNTSVSPLGSMG